jgi:hypothetical protein
LLQFDSHAQQCRIQAAAPPCPEQVEGPAGFTSAGPRIEVAAAAKERR